MTPTPTPEEATRPSILSLMPEDTPEYMGRQNRPTDVRTGGQG